VMHWRGATPEQAARIEQETRALFEPAAQLEGFKLQPFEAGLELRAGRDKGAAVRVLLSECADCGPVAFLGDDLTDEAAFAAVEGRGLGILVRPEHRQTAAGAWLRPPEEIKWFLEKWLRAANNLTAEAKRSGVPTDRSSSAG
jgi:trehalose 6-phosphate phosphatase